MAVLSGPSSTVYLSSLTTYSLQGSWLDWFVETANEYPYLWAVYVFSLVLPFVLCAACCVKSKVSGRQLVVSTQARTMSRVYLTA